MNANDGQRKRAKEKAKDLRVRGRERETNIEIVSFMSRESNHMLLKGTDYNQV